MERFFSFVGAAGLALAALILGAIMTVAFGPAFWFSHKLKDDTFMGVWIIWWLVLILLFSLTVSVETNDFGTTEVRIVEVE